MKEKELLPIAGMTDYGTMAYAFYNVFRQMSREFNQFFEVVLFFKGDEGEDFASLMESLHNPQQFDLVTLID